MLVRAFTRNIPTSTTCDRRNRSTPQSGGATAAPPHQTADTWLRGSTSCQMPHRDHTNDQPGVAARPPRPLRLRDTAAPQASGGGGWRGEKEKRLSGAEEAECWLLCFCAHLWVSWNQRKAECCGSFHFWRANSKLAGDFYFFTFCDIIKLF